MKKDAFTLARQLEPFLENLAEYRSNARMLAAVAAEETPDVSNHLLQRVEETSDEVRSDVDRLSELIRSLREPSAIDLALITGVADDLRLVLLEITETGTRLYSKRSDSPRSRASERDSAPTRT